MLRESVSGLPLSKFSKILIVALRKHIVDNNVRVDSFLKQFTNVCSEIELLQLDDYTQNQVETVAIALDYCRPESFTIKDSDNYFECDTDFGDSVVVATYDLHKCNKVKAGNKSYVKSINNEITHIVEKEIISSTFCCGMYYFPHVESFQHGEATYISHVVNNCIKAGLSTKSVAVDNYIDWGTLSDWQEYCQLHTTIFCDIDGVLFANAGEYLGIPWGEGQPLQSNIDKINQLAAAGCQIILTTSRPESYREVTIEQIKGVNYNSILFGILPRRVLVNDFSNTNQYPSAISINLPRNSNELNLYI